MLMFINKTNKLTQLSCKQLVEFSKTGLGDQKILSENPENI